eukprot:GEMP01107714.1.p1 GENE.GEMP01107714.1~~GEMP01107714.1.p1  ORF type:complete len:115 (-),score=8.46 GEMP01107714.1:120-464(-)
MAVHCTTYDFLSPTKKLKRAFRATKKTHTHRLHKKKLINGDIYLPEFFCDETKNCINDKQKMSAQFFRNTPPLFITTFFPRARNEDPTTTKTSLQRTFRTRRAYSSATGIVMHA